MIENDFSVNKTEIITALGFLDSNISFEINSRGA